ncbi:uncharacterized protein P174DRAFT_437186 [Aspergillus novofumigatus IBT 16806]|uniref:Uncharacterized protein n=1 Tax=Aspergillus novofumigatus (strain IBT 16806) TaxID=1392255 RepID=A0A2I1CMB0_ASPN1|nr:uncharacterized protein P174DRAFT_437186 [Aspergillus novofumigatus IBT 16806]PKX98767.1 hypothetical protein P174DRAFT_437186 [Aspergillus novofumigatus IBT 16806]
MATTKTCVPLGWYAAAFAMFLAWAAKMSDPPFDGGVAGSGNTPNPFNAVKPRKFE